MYQESMMNDIQAAADVAKLLADPLRFGLLQFLSWAPASVAELVSATGASQPNVSNHLRLLRESELVLAERKGRQVVYKIASPAIAELISALSWVAVGKAATVTFPARGTLAQGRTCYDHLAGELGVRLLEGLVEQGAIRATKTGWDDIELGPRAENVFSRLGIERAAITDHLRRRFAFTCPDWSEEGHAHIGGHLGAVLCEHLVRSGWVEREEGGRAVHLTPMGEADLVWLLGRANEPA
jgi:DNA-binding transcriptional ArsR family regulator